MEQEVKLEQKKKKNWILITILAVIGVAILAWCIYNVIANGNIGSMFGFAQKEVSTTNTDLNGNAVSIFSIMALLFGIFLIATLGYLLGSIEIKGVSLGTAGVFLVAILYGYICTLLPTDKPIIKAFAIPSTKYLMYTMYGTVIQNIGLVLFVASVGFIAGPKFFKNLKTNAKSYVLLGAIIIITGAVCSVLFALIPGISPEFSVGILSGSLTTTPGFSAAQEAAKTVGGDVDTVTFGHAIAYPFGVIGVVLFVQLMPKFLKANMETERTLLLGKVNHIHEEKKKKFFEVDPFGLMPFAFAVIVGLIIGSLTIPLTSKGYAVEIIQQGDKLIKINPMTFSLGTTGGVLIMCLVLGHFGHIGKISLEIPKETAKIFREFGLMLFLIGAGVSGGVSLVSQINGSDMGAMIVVYGFVAGIVMTLVPMIVGYFFASKALRLPLLNNLGSITGGMTSTPALGTLVKTAGTDDVASAYAATYPIALVLIVLASQFIITLM